MFRLHLDIQATRVNRLLKHLQRSDAIDIISKNYPNYLKKLSKDGFQVIYTLSLPYSLSRNLKDVWMGLPNLTDKLIQLLAGCQGIKVINFFPFL